MSAHHQQHYDLDDDEEEEQEYDQDDPDAVEQHIAGFPAHESFDVSSFTESKSGPEMLARHIKGSFPISNAPTLEVSPESKLKFDSKNNHRKFKLEDFKISHDISEASKMSNLEEQLQILRRQLREKQKRQYGFVAKIEQLNNTNLQLERVIREKDMIIRQKEQLLLLQQKKYKEVAQSSSKSASYSSKDKSKGEGSYIDEFCPEFLSPDQSLELLSQLMTKIDKSTSIKKKILRDRKIIGIISSIMRTQ